MYDVCCKSLENKVLLMFKHEFFSEPIERVLIYSADCTEMVKKDLELLEDILKNMLSI